MGRVALAIAIVVSTWLVVEKGIGITIWHEVTIKDPAKPLLEKSL
jgi:hypothetical protein